MRKFTEVDFSLCNPEECNGAKGICVALEVCSKNLLEQEDPFEPPILLSSTMCSGCGQCVKVCPRGAFRISGGL
jgi:ferredoxin